MQYKERQVMYTIITVILLGAFVAIEKNVNRTWLTIVLYVLLGIAIVIMGIKSANAAEDANHYIRELEEYKKKASESLDFYINERDRDQKTIERNNAKAAAAQERYAKFLLDHPDLIADADCDFLFDNFARIDYFEDFLHDFKNNIQKNGFITQYNIDRFNDYISDIDDTPVQRARIIYLKKMVDKYGEKSEG